MILYEVSLYINENIFLEFKNWLHKHMAEMLQIDGFLSANIIESSIIPEKNERILIVGYQVSSMDKLNHYFNTKAIDMRQQGIDTFGDQFRAERRIVDADK